MGLMARRCSFCGQSRKGLDRLVAGHGGVAICGDCARLAVELSSVPEEGSDGDLVLTGIGRLVTNDPRHGGLLGVIEGAAVATRQGRITWLGRQRALPDRYRDLPEVECEGRMVTPGLIDAHRHLLAQDVDLAGFTEIVTTEVGAEMEQGATTVELRTWGASGPELEVTMLSAVGSGGDTLATDVVPTLTVGATPPFRGASYRTMLETVLLPTAARIASYLDLVVGRSLDTDDARHLAVVGRRYGLRPRVHVDHRDALDLALEIRAVSADGLWGMEGAGPALAEAGLVAVSIPAASWMAGRPDPGADLWSEGVTVALGTGCSAGLVPTMPMAMAVAVHHAGLTPDQALWSATRGGALAIEAPEKGRVALGADADLVMFDAEHPFEIVASPGRDPVTRVVKRGAVLGT